jgi:hypothetical protein
MKNLFLILTAGLFLLTACSKDESFETIDEQSNDVIYVLDQNQEQGAFTTMAVDNSQGGLNFTRTTDNSEFGHTSGLYAPMYQDPVILSWSANKDETGTYGTAELQISRTNYNIHVVMQTECISVDGNKAMYGAIITEVLELSGDTPPLTANWRFYFQVTDNQQGGSAGYDQISSTLIFASSRSPSLCNVYPPDHRIWSSNGYENVMNPGFVEVSNNPE